MAHVHFIAASRNAECSIPVIVCTPPLLWRLPKVIHSLDSQGADKF